MCIDVSSYIMTKIKLKDSYNYIYLRMSIIDLLLTYYYYN